MYSAGEIEAVATLNDTEYRKKLGDMPSAAKKALSSVAGLAAGYLSFQAGVSAIKSVVGAHIQQENAVEGVRAALRRQGAEYNIQTQELEKYAGELQNVTTYGDETTLAAMSQGLNMGIAADRIKEATKAAIGLAAAYNMDLNTAMQLIAKANAGNTRGLSQYGITIDSSKSKQEKFNEVLRRGADGFQIAEANAKTTGGRLQSLGNSWSDLQESIGKFIVELFEIDNAAGEATNAITKITEYIKANLDEWVFQIKYVFAYLEAGILALWAIFEPTVTYMWQCFKAGTENIIQITQWGAENVDKIWANYPDIFDAIFKDWLQRWGASFRLYLHLAVNFVKALKKAIIDGSTDGFEQMLNQAWNDFAEAVSSPNVDRALARAGVGLLPEMKTGDYGAMIDKYAKLGDTLAKIDRERDEKQQRLQLQYAQKLANANQKMQGNGGNGGGVAGEGKRNTVGSFSAAFLAAQLGTNSPERETAKNTAEMVNLQRRTLEKIGSGSGGGIRVN